LWLKCTLIFPSWISFTCCIMFEKYFGGWLILHLFHMSSPFCYVIFCPCTLHFQNRIWRTELNIESQILVENSVTFYENLFSYGEIFVHTVLHCYVWKPPLCKGIKKKMDGKWWLLFRAWYYSHATFRNFLVHSARIS